MFFMNSVIAIIAIIVWGTIRGRHDCDNQPKASTTEKVIMTISVVIAVIFMIMAITAAPEAFKGFSM